MRKSLLVIATLIFLSNTATTAQNYFAYNSDNVRTSVDGAASDFMHFNFKKKNRGGPDPRQAFTGVLFLGLDGGSSGFYGGGYNFAYPLKEILDGGLFIACNPSLGLSGSANSRTGSSISFGLDVPIMAELHLGEVEGFGGILGLGVAYSYMSSSEVEIAHKAIGPVASAALRVPIAGQTYLLRASYQLNLTKTKVLDYSTGDVLGFSIGWVF
jgi:hypothetical protein